jgi:DNA-directed RNA polymerase specialized sigma24 family protein
MAERAHEVKKLFYAGGFVRVLLREGLDPEDFLQEVYRGLLARNEGTCPWDHTKSSFGHYVHIVIRCILSNYLRKERRRSSMETVTEDGEIGSGLTTGTGSGSIAGGGDDFSRREILKGLFSSEGDLHLAVEIVKRLEEGRSRKEAAEGMGLPMPQVEALLRTVRQGLQG